MSYNFPYWVRRLARELQEASPVKYAHLYNDRIRVQYNTGFKRSYIYNYVKRRIWSSQISKDDKRCNWPVKLDYEFTWGPFSGEESKLSKYFHIPRNRINDLSYIEKELLIQHLIEILISGDYIKPHITESMIDAELKWLANVNHIYFHNIVDLYAAVRKHPRPGRPIIEKYYDISHMYRDDERKTLSNAFSNSKILFSALQKLLCKKKWDFNITTIHSMLYGSGYGPKWHDPSIFGIVIKQLFNIDRHRVLVDASPNLHEKILSSWMLGCKYATLNGTRPPIELINRIGVEVVKSTKPHDLLVVDNNFKELQIDRIKYLRSICKDMLVFVPTTQHKQLSSVLKPTKAIKIKILPIRSDRKLEYLFIYLG